MERATGFEPATSTLGRWHSAAELRPLVRDPTGSPGPGLRGRPPILIIAGVAIKRNLPLLAGLALFALGAAALAFFLRRTDEELIREAAAKLAAPLGPVAGIRVHGSVADIALANRPAPFFAEFVKQDGAWTFSKDLAADFEDAMKVPAVQGELLQHLAQHVADRWNTPVTLKEGLGYRYVLDRNAQGFLVGQVFVDFAYPKQGGRQQLGGYRESFRFADGHWAPQHDGALFDRLPPPRR